MRSLRAVCATAVLAVLIVPSAGQAATTLAGGSFTALGAPFDLPPDVYNLYYWSGAYADATDGGHTEFDNQYDPFDMVWENVSSLAATASYGGAGGMAAIDSGYVVFLAGADLLPGHNYANGYADFEHWIDFETQDADNTVGVAYDFLAQLETHAVGELAYVDVVAWVMLDQWQDDNPDGLIDYDEWYPVQDEPFFYVEAVFDIDAVDDSASGEFWFDPFGPGVYSLGIYGWVEAAAMTTVPAPTALLLTAIGLPLLAALRRRRTL